MPESTPSKRMFVSMKTKVVYVLILSLAAFGCGGASPYTKAVGSFGDATGASTEALAKAPTTLSRSCWKLADLAYLQSRLERLRAEGTGVPLDENHNGRLGFNEFRKQVLATGSSSYEKYCTDLEATSGAFSLSLGVLLAYGESLKALAEVGGYDGADASTIVTGVTGIANKVRGAEEASSKAVGAIADAVGGLADVMVAKAFKKRVEREMERYIAEADPKVGALVQALGTYIDAVGDELKVKDSDQIALLDSLELSFGLVGASAPAPACAESSGPLVGPKAAPDRVLTEVCLRVALLQSRINTQSALAYFTFALQAAEEVKDSRELRASFRDVLNKLRAAHAKLHAAGEKHTEIRPALAEIADLIAKVNTLKAALNSDEEG